MVATATRKAQRAKAFAEAQAKADRQRAKNSSNDGARKSKSKPPVEESSDAHDNTESTTKPEPQAKERNNRFIVFIGNLPYTATTAQIKQHFASVNPISIRHSTDKTTGKSKGFAFLEFDDYSRMDVCIRTFHHSLFGAKDADTEADKDKETPKDSRKRRKGEEKGGGRRINVELTVGGGGSKSVARKQKLKAKNEKLQQERQKRGTAMAAATGPAGGKKVQAPEGEKAGDEGEDENHIHPSRRFKVKM